MRFNTMVQEVLIRNVMTRRTLTLLAGIGLIIPGALAGRTRHPVVRMEATAFTVDAKPTAAGTAAHEGIVAADPAVLPLGSRIRVTNAGAYNGIYVVTDTGNKVVGRHIDVYMPSAAEAKQFGKKVVRVQVIETGSGKQDAREKDAAVSTGAH